MVVDEGQEETLRVEGILAYVPFQAPKNLAIDASDYIQVPLKSPIHRHPGSYPGQRHVLAGSQSTPKITKL